jgi:AraC family transcriptional regulator, regulatory protein of adaptative response / methylphosphotriester-DNA alkyltransferase methyltransferase
VQQLTSLRPPIVLALSRRPRTEATRSALYRDAVAIIEREYPSDLRLDGVAARIFTSRRSLQRAFTDAGTSFRTEHLRTRLDAAAELLRADPGQTVHHVSHAVGYRQPAQFAKAFRRQFGMSPAEFREAAIRTAG